MEAVATAGDTSRWQVVAAGINSCRSLAWYLVTRCGGGRGLLLFHSIDDGTDGGVAAERLGRAHLVCGEVTRVGNNAVSVCRRMRVPELPLAAEECIRELCIMGGIECDSADLLRTMD